jgi:DNA-3-methyladenine glycosylase
MHWPGFVADADARTSIEGFFGRPAPVVAPELLGSSIVADGVTIRLTEVEAYSGEVDPASHAFRGRTRRNLVMFGPPGRVYVYFIYGMHWAVNLVCERDEVASAVLLRAGEVVSGEERARLRRGGVGHRQLARGPGNLASSLGVDGSMTGTTLWDGPVRWSPREAGQGSPRVTGVAPTGLAEMVEAGPRVGVSSAPDVAWRFWLAGDPTVSAYRKHVRRRRPGR